MQKEKGTKMSYTICKKLTHFSADRTAETVYCPIAKDITETKQGALYILVDRCLMSSEKINDFVIIGEVSEACDLYESKKGNGSL